MAGIIDTLVTELVYKANTKEIDQAEKAVAALEKENEGLVKQLDEVEKQQRATAAASRELTAKQIDLREKLNATTKETNDLRAAKRELIATIDKETGATEEQKRRLAELDDGINKASTQTRGYREELNKLSLEQSKNSLNQKKLSGTHGDLRAQQNKTTASLNKNKDAMDKAGKKGSIMGSQLAKLGLVFAAIQAGLSVITSAVNGFMSLSRMVIETGATFDGLRARLKTTTGSVAAANEAFGMVREFAKATPFELEDVTTAFVRLKSLGLTPSTEALKAYGNIAAAQGKPIMDFVEAVADAATGEFERLKEFGIKASAKGDEVAFTFAGVTTRVGKNAREITEFLQQLGETQFAGAMEDQMQTFNGQVSNLQDNWSQFLDSIAQQGPMDTAAEGMSMLSDIMTEDLAASMAGMIDGVMQKFVDIFEHLDDGTGEVSQTFEAFIEILGLVGRVLSPLLDLLGALVNIIMAAVQVVGALAGVFNDVYDAILNLLRPAERLNNLWGELGSLIGTTGRQSKLWFEQEESMAKSLIGTYLDVAKARGLMTPVGQMTDAELNQKLQEGTLTAEEAAERQRRINAREVEEKRDEADKQAKTRKEAEEKKIKDTGDEIGDMPMSALRAYASDPRVPEKLRKKANKEIEKRNDDAITDTFKAMTKTDLQTFAANTAEPWKVRKKAMDEIERREKKAAADAKKKGEKEDKKTLAHQIDEQLKENARKVAQARTARAFRERKITADEMAKYEEDLYTKTYTASSERYRKTGELPMGIAQDVRQVSRTPAEADLAGRIAPPVISIQMNNYNITGNEFTTQVEGQFATTASEVARLSLGEFRRNLNLLLGEATPTPEHR